MSSVMIRVNQVGTSALYHAALVAFDFAKKAEEAVDIMGDSSRYLDLTFGAEDTQALELIDQFVGQKLGNRAGLWERPSFHSLPTDSQLLSAIYFKNGRATPWSGNQTMCLRTLLWTAHHSGQRITLPMTDQLGLIAGEVLHDAVKQTLLAQAAFWALTRATLGVNQRPA